MKIRRLSTRLVLWLVPTTAAILLGAVFYQFEQSKELVVAQRLRESDLLRRLADAELHRLLDPAKAATDIIASQIPNASLDEARIKAFLVEFLDENPGIFGSTIALEPGAVAPGSPRIAPYFHRQKEREEYQFVDLTKNDYLEDEWYAKPRAERDARWSRPYFDDGGGEALMITYSAPFDRRIEGTSAFGGVVTADVTLDRMTALLNEAIGNRPGLELAITAAGGEVIAHSSPLWSPKDTFAIDLTDRCGERAPFVQRYLEEMEPQCYDSAYLGSRVLALTRALDVQGWTLVLGIDREVAFANARRTKNQIMLATAVGLLAMVAIIVLVSRRVSRPVALLAETTRTIAEVNLDFELPAPKGHDEIAGLQNDFLHMRDSLRDNIAKLQRETEARQKLESELEIARSIQMGLLPTRASVGGALRDVEISAKLLPAKAVGGDLYNYFYVDDDTLCFAVGDVSDKGVPAALFMARTNTLVRPATRYFRELDTVLGWLANELTMGNSDCMFVTMLCCAMNLRTGTVSLANASHLAPLLVRHDGSVELKDIQFGPPLGVSSRATYPIGEVMLEVGDAIILYSDGVTEAMNQANEEFGEERLLELAKGFATMPTDEIAGVIVEAVNAHAGTAPQSDDITVLVLRRTKEKTDDA